MTEEGRLLQQIQGDDVIDYDIDAYATRLSEILDRKVGRCYLRGYDTRGVFGRHQFAQNVYEVHEYSEEGKFAFTERLLGLRVRDCSIIGPSFEDTTSLKCVMDSSAFPREIWLNWAQCRLTRPASRVTEWVVTNRELLTKQGGVAVKYSSFGFTPSKYLVGSDHV